MKHFYTTLFLIIASFTLNAQCNNLNEYGFVLAPTTGTATISTCSFQGEYSVIDAVAAATIYECAISDGSYITIRQGSPAGPVVAAGTSPLNWTSTVAGQYFAHWNIDANCGVASNCLTTSIKYISPAFPCSGVPAPGNTISSSGNTVCPNANFNLSLQNPLLGSGLTYQWYSSTDGVNYSPIAGANAAIYSTSISSATYFYCSEDCSGSSTNSTPVYLTIAPFNQCYCVPLYFSGTQAGDLISNVEIEGTTLANNTGFVAGGPSYTFFTGQPNYTATLTPSNSYNLNISTGEWGSQGYAAWIDYNDDGIFDITERIGFTQGTIGSGFTDNQINATSSFVISLACTPPAGSHRLRIRGAYFVNGDLIDPCSEYGYGETEEYQITIAAPPACPSAGLMTGYTSTQTTASVSWALNCSSASVFNIEYGPQGFTPGTGTLLTNQLVTIVNDTASFSFTGLTATTTYDFYFQAVCSGSTSSWSATNTFTTACGSITALGWCEGFDNTSSSEQCWSVLNVNGDFSSWDTNTEFNQLNGNNCASISTDFNAGANDDWLISPQLVLTGSELLSFNFKVISEIEPNDLKVKISTTGNAPADFTTTLLSLDSIANVDYVDTSINLSAYAGNVYLAFHIPPGGLDGWVLYLDQICIGECSGSTIADDSIQICASNNSLDLTTVLSVGQSLGTWNLPTNQNAIVGNMLLLDSLNQGSYSIQYLVNNVCQSASAIATVEVFSESNAGIDSVALLCKGQPFDLFDALGGSVNQGGTWYDPNNQVLPSSNILTGNFPGQFNYDYIVSNGVCAADTSNALIVVEDCVWSGIAEQQVKQISLYPNPATELITIEWSGSVNVLKVLDASGRILTKHQVEQGVQQYIVPVNSFEKGAYWVILENESFHYVKPWIK
jgi:hypothetical protein